MDPRREEHREWKPRQDHQDLECADGSVRIDVDRALTGVRFFFGQSDSYFFMDSFFFVDRENLGNVDWHVRVDVDRALRLVRFFFFFFI
jgi:hypothetical protein